MVERDLRIAVTQEADLSIQHISTREAVELIRQAKRLSSHIYAEATPHHFTLTQEAVIRHGTLAKMNPPLREEADRLAIVQGLQDGTIDIIATDHAPHSREEKERPLTEAPSGIIGLETALALGVTNLVNTRQLSMEALIERMAVNPARMYGLPAGTLSVGSAADIVIFDAEAAQTVGKSASRSSNTPFAGQKLKGVVKYTIVDGQIAYQSD